MSNLSDTASVLLQNHQDQHIISGYYISEKPHYLMNTLNESKLIDKPFDLDNYEAIKFIMTTY